MTAVVEVEHLWTCFGTHEVHRDLSLTVEAGEVLGIVGGSGSGKTALMRQMLGLERPTKGTVRVFGCDPHSPKARVQLRHRWGVLFQNGALFSALSVLENVAMPLKELRLLPQQAVRELALARLSTVQIAPEHAPKMPAELSGGMVKRVALARALALEPELLFLDEPTAGLDPDRSEAFERLIQDLRKQLCLTVVLVTHDIDTLIALVDRVAVLADQRVVAAGPLEEVVRAEHPFVEHFFRGSRGKRCFGDGELRKDLRGGDDSDGDARD